MRDSIEGFQYVKDDSKGLTEVPIEDDQDSVRKARRSPVDRPLRKQYWQSERRL